MPLQTEKSRRLGNEYINGICRGNTPKDKGRRWDYGMKPKRGDEVRCVPQSRERDLEVKRGCYGEASAILAPYKLEAKPKGSGMEQVGE